MSCFQIDTHLHPVSRSLPNTCLSCATVPHWDEMVTTIAWLASGTAPSWTPANSFGRRPRWKSLTSIKNNWPHAGASARPPWNAGAARDRTQFPEALRPGALPAGGHRGLRGVVPGDVDQDGRDAGQCWLRCSVSSVNTDYLQHGGTGGRRDEPDFGRTESRGCGHFPGRRIAEPRHAV